MTAITVILGFIAAGTWTWIIGDHFGLVAASSRASPIPAPQQPLSWGTRSRAAQKPVRAREELQEALEGVRVLRADARN
jgi:hypothetical protein